ncbi:putative RPO31-DNA-directed RNA polymerase III, 160 kd subunit [Jimgerdemannia flammicorona]|uniref:DNA-directed RNA polymerase subunit n=1 Tax=Jimgerdemannia flammicorona TaxID=994334 RepID=A0A433QXB2_9FUNG|nr:putative RPO31-DNA-directed RNA polymerase III, 160 kd subunit [Jimgerdemannia flammicorona]
MKEQVLENAPKKIKHIQFGVLSPQDMVKLAEIEVTQRDLYNVADRTPVKHGVLDLRLGSSAKEGLCETCGQQTKDCAGHFGYIKLVLPVFHIGYFRAIITILQNICKADCSSIRPAVASCSKRLTAEHTSNVYVNPTSRTCVAPKSLKRSTKNARKLSTASTATTQMVRQPDIISSPLASPSASTHLLNDNPSQIHVSGIGTVKKVSALKIVHEKFRAKRTHDEHEEFKRTFDMAVATIPELKAHLNKAQEDMNPLKVLTLFQQISPEDCELLGLDPEHGRPELYIWQYLPVPPACIRPSVQQEGASNEDDLTAKLTEIIYSNAIIRAALEKGVTMTHLMEQWDFLQLSAAMYINAELPGVQTANISKPGRGLCQRLKGKQGRFRGNLSGKRVDFSGRTVISPDPNMRIDQVAVPELVAKILTYPERVFAGNIERLRKAVLNGSDTHPGANYAVVNGLKRVLKFPGSRKSIAADLKIGDIVERHLADGDVVLFNRQPSLHRLSIMAHYVKVKPWRTFRFNECVCAPYNADFDGDEMNMHVPQTEEARTEAMELMGVKNNLVTPRNGQPLIAATQDFITASYLLSNKDRFYSRAMFTQICSMMGDAELKIDIPPPTIWKPQRLWTGKQIFNVLFRPNRASPVLVNVETKNKSFQPKEGRASDLCPADGYLIIRNSEIMCGLMDKSTVGDGNKNSVFYIVLRDYGAIESANCMNRLAKLCARWLANQGFSIGINDVTPGKALRQIKEKKVEAAYSVCDNFIEKYQKGQLETMAGYNEEETLESKVSGVLSEVRDDLGRICMTELNKDNAPLIMAMCGSKGSQINVSQMVACVGQQIISAKRIPNGFHDRTLPHFLKYSKEPAAKGFVRNSFYTGLTPTEFFFHAVSGREGLVDTAVKTAETGYMQRRLMKALEDLTTHYDSSVRNSIGGVVQFCYGDDGLDPMILEGEGKPVEFERNLKHTRAIVDASGDLPLLPWQIDKITTGELKKSVWVKNCTENFIKELMEFIQNKVIYRLVALRQQFCMQEGIAEPNDEYEGVDIDADTDGMQFEFVLAYYRVCIMCSDSESHYYWAVSFVTILDATKAAVNNQFMITEKQLREYLERCLGKYMKAKIEPGTAVGALGAQSIGEPGTQMTLKTFHFAGVASMNITQGVPRIKEIINASKNISTPVIKAELVSNQDVKAARIVKGRVEKTLLGDVAEFVEEVYTPDQCYIGLKLDVEAINKLQLEINVYEVAHAIATAPKLKIGDANVHAQKPDRIKVYVTAKDSSSLYYNLKSLKRALPKIIIKGIPSVNRAVISEDQKRSGIKYLVVEGYGLLEVMTTEGVVGQNTTSNHIMEVQKVLGIEAARKTIIREIDETMTHHGMTIDPRHVKLLGDIMSYKGEVLGITRFGIAKMKDSVLMLASFEKTTDHLFEASLYSKQDSIEGVSEKIIMGIPMSIGTGLFKLIHVPEHGTIPAPRKLLFDTPEHHLKMPF